MVSEELFPNPYSILTHQRKIYPSCISSEIIKINSWLWKYICHGMKRKIMWFLYRGADPCKELAQTSCFWKPQTKLLPDGEPRGNEWGGADKKKGKQIILHACTVHSRSFVSLPEPSKHQTTSIWLSSVLLIPFPPLKTKTGQQWGHTHPQEMQGNSCIQNCSGENSASAE